MDGDTFRGRINIAMSYPLWMSGYYDNKNATYCQITDTAYAELQDKIEDYADEYIMNNG